MGLHPLWLTAKPPQAFDAARAGRTREDFARMDHGRLRGLLADPMAVRLIEAVAGNSPFLARQCLKSPDHVADLLEQGPDHAIAAAHTDLLTAVAAAKTPDDLLSPIRMAKRRIALTAAFADIARIWSWPQVTAALSDCAEAATREAVRALLRAAAEAGRFKIADRKEPDRACGLIVLAMGKLGARELNYSSDIDLTVFFDPERMPLGEGVEPGPFAVRLTQAMVRLLQEQTADGYGFRTDLRLRPDAGSTQIAVSLEAAELYYEGFGQNWERAAMIKARPIAGDLEAGEAFLKFLQPFVFRRYLDFAAIEDIHSIKRQIHAHEGHAHVAVAGHNVKLGRGGIREIEFFVQTQQLIMGGREPALRGRRTIEMLEALHQAGHIAEVAANELTEAYAYLRTLEHRLQMIEDQQTHTLPQDDGALDHVATFMGFQDRATFEATTRRHLEKVQQHYAALFETAAPLSEKRGSLVFTGVDDDPETLETLRRIGFSRPSDVAAAVRGWHHGRVRATRSARAREKLTALTPALLDALGATPNPDAAFLGFDLFLKGLPSGVQVFSLLFANPSLLGVLADAFGASPRLAQHLGRNPSLLDAMLDAEFFVRLPEPDEWQTDLEAALAPSESLEDALDRARRWHKEQMLRIAIQVVRARIEAREAGAAFAGLATAVLRALWPRVEADLVRQHGRIPGGAAVLVGMGKLGGGEMTAASDLDLIVIYECDPAAASSGDRAVSPSVYYARLTQRLIAALSALTAEGRLYDVDMRLRPSGNKGPVAVHRDAFKAYHEADAWTWEHMALTRARIIVGNASLGDEVTAIIRATLTAPRDKAVMWADLRDMRLRLARQFPGNDPWDLKFAPGGLIDLEFIAQGLQLAEAQAHPRLLSTNTGEVLARAAEAGLLKSHQAATLIEAFTLFSGLMHALRIAKDGRFSTKEASPGLQNLLVRAGGERRMHDLETRLSTTRQKVRALLEEIAGPLQAGSSTTESGANER